MSFFKALDRRAAILLLLSLSFLTVIGVWTAFTNSIPDLKGGDAAAYYVPTRVFTVDILKSGAFPGWNPYVYTGYPHIADIQTGVFYPPNIILYLLLKPAVAFNLSIAFNILLMAFFTSRFLRLVARSEYAVWIGAATYTLSGFMANNAGTVTIVDAASWVPAVFWCTEKWLHTGRWRYCAWGGLCLAMQLLAGWPQLVLLTAIYLGVYLLFSLPRQSRPGRAFVGFVLIGVISAGIGMAQLLPTWEFKDETAAVEGSFADFISGSVAPQFAVIMFYPFLIGAGYGQLHTLHRVPYFGPIDQQVTAYYVGALPLFLAMAALFRWRKSHVVRAGSIMALLAFMLTWTGYLPTAPLLYRIPGFNLFHDHRINVAFIAFSIALLAACGADALASSDFSTGLRSRLAWAIPVGVVGLAAVLLIKARAILGSIDPSMGAMPQGWVTRLHQVMRFNSPDLMVSIGLLLAAAVLFYFWTLHPGASRIAWIAVIFVVADLAYCGLGPNWFTTPLEASPDELAAMRAMRETASAQEFRSLSLVRGAYSAISPNMNTMFRHADILGLGPLLPKRHSDLLTASTASTTRWQELLINNTVLSLLNTRFIEVDAGQLAFIERMLGPLQGDGVANRQGSTGVPVNLFQSPKSNTGGNPFEVRTNKPGSMGMTWVELTLEPNSVYELSFEVRFSDPKDWYGLGVGFASEDAAYYYAAYHWMLSDDISEYHRFRRLFITGDKPGKTQIKLFTKSMSAIYLKDVSLVQVGSFPLSHNPYRLAGQFWRHVHFGKYPSLSPGILRFSGAASACLPRRTSRSVADRRTSRREARCPGGRICARSAFNGRRREG